MAVKTYGFRYRPTSAPSGTEDRVLACSHTTDSVHCVINSLGHIGYYVSGSFIRMGTTKTQPVDSVWHSYIIEKDELGNGCIYVDGQKIGCATNFPTDDVNQVGNFKTELMPEDGRLPSDDLRPRGVSNIYTRPCCGDIDEIVVFNRQLSEAEKVDLAQSGTLSKVYTLADYKITAMADNGIIATTEKPRYAEEWRGTWDADQRTTALPTAIASITVNGTYKSLATAANDAGIWTPTTISTHAYSYYQAVESWRQMFFVSSGDGTGFLLATQLGVDTDISTMSPTLESRQSALMFAEDALRSAIMEKRQQTAEINSVASANAYADDLDAALREQTDHVIIFTTNAIDPSTGWTAQEKLIHKGDYWRTSTTASWYTWSGSAWSIVNDAAASSAASAAASAASTAQAAATTAQATANAKRRIFTSTPTVPYDIGDLWVAGSSGDIKRCITARATGSYTAGEWDVASKYTDDTTANQKSRTFIQTTAPSSGVNAGDYWLDSDDGHKPYVYKDGAWEVDTAMQSAINAQSTANAKRRIFTTTPTVPYDVGDLWVAGVSGDIKNCITARSTGGYTASEWAIASKYTDDTVANTKSRTFIQTTAPAIGMATGDYWLDSDDNYKPYVYRSGAWSVDYAMQSAINAQSTADGKTTLFGTIALAKVSAKIGDSFMYNGSLYVCNTALAATATRYTFKNWGNIASAPVQTTQTVSGSVLTEPLVYGDTYFNTGTAKWFKFTTSWVEDTANTTAIVTYTPKYLGRYLESHPASFNNGDYWLVYGLATSEITRGFWYSNNGTQALVSGLSAELQRKYRASGLEDVLYASNNGYALTSGGVYDPVGIYGVQTLELLAVNRAFIEKLTTQELEFQKSISSVESSGYEIGDNRVYLGKDTDGIFSLLLQTLIGKTSVEKFWSDTFRLYGSPSNAEMELNGNSYVNGKSFSGYGTVFKNYTPAPESSFSTTTGIYNLQSAIGVAYSEKWGMFIVRNNYTSTFRVYVSTDNGKNYPITETRTFSAGVKTPMCTCARAYGNCVYIGTTQGLYISSHTEDIQDSVIIDWTTNVSGAVLSIQEWKNRVIISTTTGSFYHEYGENYYTTPHGISSAARSCAVDADTGDAFFCYGYVTDQGASSFLAPYIYKYNATSTVTINVSGKQVKRTGGAITSVSLIGNIGVANRIIFAMIEDSSDEIILAKSNDLGETWEEVSTPVDSSSMAFANISCHDRILVLRKQYGRTYYSTDYGNTFTQIGGVDTARIEAKSSIPQYILDSGKRRLYIATAGVGGFYTYTETRDQQLGDTYEDRLEGVKYFNYPAGTTYSTIYADVNAILKESNTGTGAIGSYSRSTVNVVYRDSGEGIHFAESGVGDRLYVIKANSTLTTGLLKVAIIEP